MAQGAAAAQAAAQAAAAAAAEAPAPAGPGGQACAPLKRRACKRSPACRWGGWGARCAVAEDACAAVQGKKLRKRCARVSPMRCECSRNPQKKRGKCGSCVGSPDVGDPTVDAARPFVGIIEDPKHLVTALENFRAILSGKDVVAKALLPGIIALPITRNAMPAQCLGTTCKDAVSSVIEAGHPKDRGFALFDTENMDATTAPPSRDNITAILRSYGLDGTVAADDRTWLWPPLILEGQKDGLLKYEDFKGAVGFVNEATKYNVANQGTMHDMCKPGWIFAATYTDSCDNGEYGTKLPRLNSIGKDCYCQKNITTVATALLAQKKTLCKSNSTCESTWPLLLSFETCTDCYMYHNPLLGYGPKNGGGAPASASPANLATLMKDLQGGDDPGPVAIYKLEFYLKRLLNLPQDFEGGCFYGPTPTNCNSKGMNSTCDVNPPEVCPGNPPGYQPPPALSGTPYCKPPKKNSAAWPPPLLG